MRCAFHPDALAGFESAARHCATVGGRLAARFIDSVEASIRRLTDDPFGDALLEQDVRRCLTRVFPCAVPYTIESDYVLIVAVMHCDRNPGYWQQWLAQQP